MSPPARTYRAGIIGTGFAAEAHADALRRLPNVELAGVASHDPQRARDAAERFGAARAYLDPSALIADETLDVVHVCTINRLHPTLSMQALTAGKHVVTEKPLAVDSQMSEALATLAEEAARSGRRAAICFNYRFYGVIQQLRDLLADGQYGEMHFAHGSYLQDWLLYDTDWNWRLDPDDNGASRAIADIGSHWIDLVQFVSGQEASEVFADLGTHHPVRHRPLTPGSTFGEINGGQVAPMPIETEDFGTVLVRFASGARGTFAVSQVSPGRKNQLRFQIDTAEAAFAWDQEQPNAAWIGRRSSSSRELTRAPSAASWTPQPPPGHPEGWRDTFMSLFADFYASLASRQNGSGRHGSYATFDDGHRTTLVVEAIIESHRTQSWVRVHGRDRASA
ncbi:MAG TPA: Gfo/Idh/MocA family oxidoreductase [Solirubrobacteraceae bacterium]|nr:Gfo/Idh/MocA family oxidoreductase [Solirubrobacteraceae bacterium]